MGIERLEDGARVVAQGTVVERQDHLAVVQKVVAAVVHAAEQRAACGVDLDHARKAENIVLRGAGGNRWRALRRACDQPAAKQQAHANSR